MITTNAEGCDAYEALNRPAPGYIAQFLGIYRVHKYGKGSTGDSEPIVTMNDDDNDDCDDRRANDDDDDEECPEPGTQESATLLEKAAFNLLVFDQKKTTS